MPFDIGDRARLIEPDLESSIDEDEVLTVDDTTEIDNAVYLHFVGQGGNEWHRSDKFTKVGHVAGLNKEKAS